MSDTEPIEPIDNEPNDTLDSDARRPAARRGLVTAAVVVVALVAAGLTGATLTRSGSSGDQAALAASTGSSTASAAPHRKVEKRGGPGMMRGRGHLLGAGGALHGTFVVPDGSGGYTTMLMQRGKAKDVSSTSITVTSEDGFVQTYALTSGTGVGADPEGAAGIADGADVAVMGTKKGDTVTAQHVIDLAAFGGRGPGGMGGMGGMGGPGPGGPGMGAQGSAYGA